MISPLETSTNINKNEMADYSSEIDQNRIILAQALMKAYNENPEMMNITVTECNNFFDGDRNVLIESLIKEKFSPNFIINGNTQEMNNNNFGKIINSYIQNSNEFKNENNKIINDINKSNFLSKMIETDPLVQIYYHFVDRTKLYNGIIVTPVEYNEKKVKIFTIIKKDGSIDKIRGDVFPIDENYLVISTNERSTPHWKEYSKYFKAIKVGDRRLACMALKEIEKRKINTFSSKFNIKPTISVITNNSDDCNITPPPVVYDPTTDENNPYNWQVKAISFPSARFNSYDDILNIEGFAKGQPEIRVFCFYLTKNLQTGEFTGRITNMLYPENWYNDPGWFRRNYAVPNNYAFNMLDWDKNTEPNGRFISVIEEDGTTLEPTTFTFNSSSTNGQNVSVNFERVSNFESLCSECPLSYSFPFGQANNEFSGGAGLLFTVYHRKLR